MPAVVAALSALAFGVGDFLGGLSSRRMAVFLAALTAQSAGLVLLLGLAGVTGGSADGASLLWGMAAGTSGAIGLGCFYWALAVGQVSVVAPVSAVMSALVPLVAGLLQGERPAPLSLAGALVALPAIVLIAREPRDPVGDDERSERPPPGRRRLVLIASLVGGLGFGGFFVLLSRAAEDTGFWPLVAARGTAVVLVALVVVATRPGRPNADGVRTGLLAGCFDVSANALFVVAERSGLLTLVGVISAMYPASTVVLARVVLRERLARHQIGGLGLAAGAVAAIALG